MTENKPPIDALRMPIQEFRHSDTGSDISLVGMIHVAESRYYDSVQIAVDERAQADYTVHYELLRKPTKEEFESVNLVVQRKVELLRKTAKELYSWFEQPEIGLVKQLQALHYHESWENHDLSLLEMAERAPLRILGTQALIATAGSKLLNAFEPKDRVDLLCSLLKQLGERGFDRREVGLLRKILLGDMSDVVLDYRNNIALGAIDAVIDEDPEANLALVWGAGHLPGLGDGLRKRGYVKVDEVLIDAIKFKN